MASYTITKNITNVSSDYITLIVQPDAGYSLPETVEVLNGTFQSWDSSTGELVISNVTDETVVNIVPVAQTIEYFSIKVNYDSTDPIAIYLSSYLPSNTPTIFDGSLYYSKNESDWVSMSNTAETYIPVNNGETIYFRGKNNTYVGPGLYNSLYRGFRAACATNITAPSNIKFTVSGNILTLLDYENLPTEYTHVGAFAELFNDVDNTTSGAPTDTSYKLIAVHEIDASNLELPSFTYDSCYGMMFRNNITVHMPKLPALYVDYQAYRAMFSGTTNLYNVSALPAKEIGGYSYYSMFNNISYMDKLPEIAVTTFSSETSPYGYMFSGLSNTGISTALDIEGLVPWYLSGSLVNSVNGYSITPSMFSWADLNHKVADDLDNGTEAVLYVDPNVWTIAKLGDL